MQLGFGQPDRIELLRFLLTLDKSRADKFRNELSVFPPHVADAANAMSGDDTLKLTYDVFVKYFGNVVDCLTALNAILSDPNVILKVELHELQHGECLIAQVLERLRAVQETVRRRG